jgi:hypothetical protein
MNRFGLPELSRLTDPLGFDLRAVSSGVFGFFLLLTMLLRPQGFVPSARRLRFSAEVTPRRRRRRRRGSRRRRCRHAPRR